MTRKMALLGVLGCITPNILHAQESAPGPAPRTLSQTAPVSDSALDVPAGENEVEALVVTGQRQRGAVLGDIAPEETFSAADVRAFGVSSINELLAELSPQTTSGRGGAPVVLLNGRRISSLAEIRDIPTEAISRVEILPEEVALKYGYSAEQKVVNVVLRQRFRASTAEASLSAPSAGGQTSEQLDASSLRLNKDGRLNLALKVQHSDALLESDRDLVAAESTSPYGLSGNVASTTTGAELDPALSALVGAPVTLAGVPASARTGAASLADFAANANAADSGDNASYRSLLPRTDQVSFNAVYSRPLFNTVLATFNASGSVAQSTAQLGLAGLRLVIPTGNPYSPFAQDVVLYRYRTDLGALEQQSRDLAGHLGFTLNSDAKDWRWSLTGNYDHGHTRTLTDRGVDSATLQARLDALDPTFNPFAALPGASFRTDRARSTSDTGNLQLVLNGSLARLPAGELSTTLKLGAEGTRLDSTSRRSGVESGGDLSRSGANAQLSLDLPIASQKTGVLAGLGNLSANLNLAINQLSDFGALTTIGYGLNWSPITPVSFIASMTRQQNAPTMAQLGAPSVATPDVRVFDFVQGQSLDITRVSGGNPDLKAEERSVLKIGATVRPPAVSGLSLNANYFRTRIDNPISSFPAATAATEAAFPDRFTRDADGVLTRIDARAVNFARQESDQLRWGLNYSRQIGKTPPRPALNPAQARSGDNQGAARSPASSSPSQAASNQAPNLSLLQGALPPGGGEPQTISPPAAPSASDTGRSSPGPGQGPGGANGPRGPGGFGPPPGAGAARLQLALFHTIHLRERVFIADGATPLDLLDGDALSSSGGQPRHEVEAQAGFTKNGMGARLSANWRAATHIDGASTRSTGSLRFSDLTTVNLRLFANLGARRDWVAAYPVLRGSRVSLSITNLFDNQLTVRDAAGAVPVSYQPDYLDPLGRSVRVSLRKVFF